MSAAVAELTYRRERLSGQSMAFLAEFYRAGQIGDGEVYAHATARHADLGRLAVSELADIEQTGIYQQVLTEYLTGIEENLTTDEEYGDQLKFDGLRAHRIIDGQTVDKSGQPVIDLVKAGRQASLQAAKTDRRMAMQAERDKGDVAVAAVVDSLEVGEVYVVTSMDPKEALARDPEFWSNKGYKAGMAVFQVYYRASEDEMLAGAYSVMRSNEAALRDIMTDLGASLPESLSDNHWTLHGARFNAPRDYVEGLGRSLQAKYKKRIRHQGRQVSVSDLVADEEHMLVEYFNALIVPLCRARHTGRSEPVIADFARRLLPRSDSLSAEERQTLIRVANARRFSINDTRIMEGFIRYAVVEELRKRLDEEFKGIVVDRAASTPPEEQTPQAEAQVVPQAEVRAISQHGPLVEPVVAASERLASNVERGRAAGRAYLGCSPTGQPGGGSESSQDVFGGKAESEGLASQDVECEYQGTFCYCCPYNSDGTKAKEPVVVTARKRVDGVAECKRPGCHATLDSRGNANKGSIYARAMRLQAAQNKLKTL